jgi:hypothetical protein
MPFRDVHLSLLLAVGFLAFFILACSDSSNKNAAPTPTPTPEVLITPERTKILDARNAIDKQLGERFFARCSEKPKRRWFVLFEKDGQRTFFEFVNLRWDVDVKGIRPVDFDMNGIKYIGEITFQPYQGEEESKRSFYSAYDKDGHSWRKYENLTFAGLPSSVMAREKNGVWEFETARNVWTTTFPYQKPNVPCELLNNRQSLSAYEEKLFGKEEKPDTNVNSNSNGESTSNTNSNNNTRSPVSDESKSEKPASLSNDEAKKLALRFLNRVSNCKPAYYYLVQHERVYDAPDNYTIFEFTDTDLSIKDIDRDSGSATIYARVTGGKRYEWATDKPSKEPYKLVRNNTLPIDFTISVISNGNEWKFYSDNNRNNQYYEFITSNFRLPYSCDEIQKNLGL